MPHSTLFPSYIVSGREKTTDLQQGQGQTWLHKVVSRHFSTDGNLSQKFKYADGEINNNNEGHVSQ